VATVFKDDGNFGHAKSTLFGTVYHLDEKGIAVGKDVIQGDGFQ
jgi:hypothetical protein